LYRAFGDVGRYRLGDGTFRALDFIRARKNAVLTTIRANGRPQLSNILYVHGDDDVLRISVTDSRAKTVNMRRDPRVSLYVPATTSTSTWSSRARPRSPGGRRSHDDTVEQLIAYYRAGNGEHSDWDDYRATMVADGRLIAAVHPSAPTAW